MRFSDMSTRILWLLIGGAAWCADAFAQTSGSVIDDQPIEDSSADTVENQSQQAFLYIIRSWRAPPAAFPATIKLDEQPYASIPIRMFTWVYIPAGEHEIKIEYPLLAGGRLVKFKFRFESGGIYQYEIPSQNPYELNRKEVKRIEPADLMKAIEGFRKDGKYTASTNGAGPQRARRLG